MNKALFILFLFLSTPLSAANGQFTIEGHAVKEMTLSLGVSSIDFGDVYKDSEVESVLVDFYVNAEDTFDYTVELSNDDSSGTIQMSRSLSSGYTGGSLTYIETANGLDQRHDFYVDLATGNMSGDLAVTITVMVMYNNID
ncbi:hypothetical protein Ping_3060 [Psychromonas ingrahamii 37]|uniref:Uncharacterized protein n=1 Tax=Psychromonas ingrahamii (strain DSM 17664 / CCUG 51855 / 37) TaxID=357804 RepID=A1SZ45_PSYIN|nr:hypothetical protein [Psychromonas ingrahamii]ABM04760.1 hypothetical protein Ping_3060 [Psychromonas ingrahamii 37]